MVDFKNMRGGDPEGQAKNNSKKPEKKPEGELVYLTKRDDWLKTFKAYTFGEKLHIMFYNINKLEDMIEDIPKAPPFMAENQPLYREAITDTWILSGEIRNALNVCLEDLYPQVEELSVEEICQTALEILKRDA